jgi:hypothetical protein
MAILFHEEYSQPSEKEICFKHSKLQWYLKILVCKTVNVTMEIRNVWEGWNKKSFTHIQITAHKGT